MGFNIYFSNGRYYTVSSETLCVTKYEPRISVNPDSSEYFVLINLNSLITYNNKYAQNYKIKRIKKKRFAVSDLANVCVDCMQPVALSASFSAYYRRQKAVSINDTCPGLE
jgi:hypothetical protein